MSTPQPTNNYMEEVDKINSEIDYLKSERDYLVERLQDECEHPIKEVREVDYKSSNYGSSLRPFRVCLRCGYAEEGWGCGYWRLHRSEYGPVGGGIIRNMDRDQAWKHVRTYLTQEKLNKKRFDVAVARISSVHEI